MMILMMGIAGSGKGTQSKLLAEKDGFHLVTMGDVLRQNASDKQKAKMNDGILLGDDEIIAIIDRVLADIPSQEKIILDGFPRTVKQAEWLANQADQGRFELRAAVHLIASRDAVRERLLSRARGDDVGHAIETRFEEYERSTAPILEWLRSHHIEVFNINGERSVEEVHQQIVDHLEA